VLGNSATYQTFVASALHGGLDTSSVVVYDNSPSRQVSSAEEEDLFAYKHDPNNGGIAAAYNWALEIAKLHCFSWMLLLDQDTRLPLTFLESLLGTIELHNSNQTVAAIVPFVNDGLVGISPSRVLFGRRVPLQRESHSLAECEVTAINSGAAIRVSFVQSLGGFNQNYKLDCLDHWLFRRLYAERKRVALSGSVLEHNLSVSDYRNQVSLARYSSILVSEVLFMTTEKRRAEMPLYIFRLLLRSVRQLIVYRRPDLAVLTFAMFVRITVRRAQSSRFGL
jgi:GT2 family glycosyltransferase